ncbi:type I-E CRISPR-associated protein Cas7/Cse4/CasC [Streptomyces sp. RFCAC02]|uniref:type I-E CRISPR-associated protein Cas7/Cse4/CasC n=1 Tax=Streptomyces sp. RFCAC02 TaxID=2499143 RepID=UPI00101FD1A2|nr:type I-E CRISPR-associated protein Cas7/Cse4/CasC [Streptomyces sp. RFCAC02]
MKSIYVDVHALQTVPPSNLNRDDTGAPKSAVYGGARRARVSSQAWKRATREYFGEQKLLDPRDLGVRTRKVVDLLAERITRREPSIDRAAALTLAAEVFAAIIGKKLEPPARKNKGGEEGQDAVPESKYLMFLGSRQLDNLADLAIEGAADPAAFLKDKKNKVRAKELADTEHSVDIALFGRMVADAADINVDAAVQVAHALSVHPVENESDYFTAVDDRNMEEESGAGMISTTDFNSATLYRYASVNVHQLAATLGDGQRDDRPATEPVRRAVEAFIEAFVSSMPTGKINTFGNHTLPDAVLVTLRTTRPISYVAAFEDPVTAHTGSGHLREAAERLAGYIPDIERAYGNDATRSWVLRIGLHTGKLTDVATEVPKLSALVAEAGQAVADALGQPA